MKRIIGDRQGAKRLILALIASACLIILVTVAVIAVRYISKQTKLALYPIHYQALVERYGEEYDIPLDLLYGVIRSQSSFDPDARSHAGALGLMQIMPNTCEWIGWRLGENVEHERMRDPAWNIRYGCYLLSYYYGKYEDWDLVLCAYNAGDGNVDKWLADPTLSQDGRLMEIPFGETKRYLGRVKEAAREYAELYPEIMQSNRNAVT